MTSTPALKAQDSTLPEFIWDDALIRRYDLSGPRYTSYPTAVELNQNYPIEGRSGRTSVATARAIR